MNESAMLVILGGIMFALGVFLECRSTKFVIGLLLGGHLVGFWFIKLLTGAPEEPLWFLVVCAYLAGMVAPWIYNELRQRLQRLLHRPPGA